MTPTLSEKCQFHVIPSSSSSSSVPPPPATAGPTVHCESLKANEQEEMETESEGQQLSITINVHVGKGRNTCMYLQMWIVGGDIVCSPLINLLYGGTPSPL